MGKGYMRFKEFQAGKVLISITNIYLTIAISTQKHTQIGPRQKENLLYGCKYHLMDLWIGCGWTSLWTRTRNWKTNMNQCTRSPFPLCTHYLLWFALFFFLGIGFFCFSVCKESLRLQFVKIKQIKIDKN